MAINLQNLTPGQTYAHDTAVFVNSTSVDVNQSNASWSILDTNGNVVATGNADVVGIQAINNQRTKVLLEGSIAIPSALPANIVGTYYTLLWTLNVSFGSPTTVEVTQQENLTIVTPTFELLGAKSTVDIYGETTKIEIVLGSEPTALNYTIYNGNDIVLPSQSVTLTPVTTADGFSYSTNVDTSQLPSASLTPYLVMWDWVNADSSKNTELGNLFAINPKIYAVSKNLQQYIQRQIISVDQTADVTFTPDDLFTWLRIGKSHFNAFGSPTDFSMTNPSDNIAYFWTIFSAINALRSQTLVEALKSFDYGGQQVTLSVDHSQAFEALASALENQVQDNARQFKTLLGKRGLTSGDGNVVGNEMSLGSMGCVGITLSPVSNLRSQFNKAGGGNIGINLPKYF